MVRRFLLKFNFDRDELISLVLFVAIFVLTDLWGVPLVAIVSLLIEGDSSRDV
jgi:hypothetical protein